MSKEKVYYFMSFSDFAKGYEDEKSAKEFIKECEQNG